MAETMSLKMVIQLLFFAAFTILFIFTASKLYQAYFPDVTAADDLKQRIEFLACEPRVSPGETEKSCPRTTPMRSVYIFGAEQEQRLILFDADTNRYTQSEVLAIERDYGDTVQQSSVSTPVNPAICVGELTRRSTPGIQNVRGSGGTTTDLTIDEENCAEIEIGNVQITGTNGNAPYVVPTNTEGWGWGAEYSFLVNLTYDPAGQGTLTVSNYDLESQE